MKAVFSAIQMTHKPTRFLNRGHIVDYPEQPERAKLLLDAARAAGVNG